MAAPQPNKINALTQCPLTAKTITAGPQTAAEPTSGTRENNAVTNPHKAGEGNPSIQKPNPARIPWDAPTAITPYTLATMELLIPVNNRSTCPRVRGTYDVRCSLIDPPSRKRKNKVKNAITASARKEMKFRTICAPHENKYWLVCSSHRNTVPRKSS